MTKMNFKYLYKQYHIRTIHYDQSALRIEQHCGINIIRAQRILPHLLLDLNAETHNTREQSQDLASNRPLFKLEEKVPITQNSLVKKER